MTMKLSGGCQPLSTICRSASSKASRTRRRISVASSMDFEAGSIMNPLGVGEVGVSGAGGEDEIVEGKLGA